MVRLFFRVALVAVLLWLAAGVGSSRDWPGVSQAFAQQPVPVLNKRVTDLTGTLTPDQSAQLEAQLAGIEQRKGAQVAVLMVPTLAGEPIEQFGIRVGETWKIGRASVLGRKVDDGVIVIVAKSDRKVRIEVGYGLEGAIPDALAKRIISESVAPKFRADDYAGGLAAAVSEIGRLIEGEALPAPADRQQGGRADDMFDGFDPLGLIAFVVFAGFIATRILGRMLGSLGTGIGAGVVATIAGFTLVTAVALGLGAFILLLVLSSFGGLRRAGGHTYHSGPTIFTGGGGGWGGGGGGFSGGGGGFGGGGASGDW